MANLTKAQREERLEDLRAQASQLQELTSQPGWQLLIEAAVGRKRKDYEHLTRPAEIPVRKFDYDRGFAGGLDYLLSIPEKAQETLRLAERSAKTIHPEEG